MTTDPEPHHYHPSIMHMGDCSICGNLADHPNHIGCEPPRRCRECGIDHIEPGMEIDGWPLCWAEDDLCSRCQDILHVALERDAARYRYLRNRQTRQLDLGIGGIFAGRIQDNVILGGEDLDRAIDAALGQDIEVLPTLEERLADCLADCVDTPLLTVHDPDINAPLDLRLNSFKRELAERAAELLEEAGR